MAKQHPIASPWYRRYPRSVLRLVPFVLLGACDLATSADRVPTTLVVADSVVTTIAGQRFVPRVVVLDQSGQPFERLPVWVRPVLTVASNTIARVSGSEIEAVAPGAAEVQVALADLQGRIRVRVNPSALRLRIDSVAVSQAEQNQELRRPQVMVPGRDVTLRVYMTGDQPNFFRPKVRVQVQGPAGGTVLEAERDGDSVPQFVDPFDAGGYWEVSIPGALVGRGTVVTIEADPERIVPRAEGSVDRFPGTGSHRLPTELRLSIESVYLTQAVQRLDGLVPLVADRAALLRVFAVSDLDIAVRPVVRARFFRNGIVVHQADLQRAPLSFPGTVVEGSLAESWNTVVPASVVQPGLSVVVEADPSGSIPRSEGSVVRFPEMGSRPLDVRAVPTLWLRIIPVYQTQNGLLGRATPDRLENYLRPLRAFFPVARVEADIRQAYHTNARLDTESGWNQLLREVEALRTTDGSDRYYYGMHTNPAGAPWAGLGYIAWPAAIGHDPLPNGAETLAHELGHNFSLLHAPCGGPASVDPSFPHAGGTIGVFGYDTDRNILIDPGTKDVMSYCGPRWLSDYHYTKVLDYRDQFDWAGTGPDRTQGAEPAVLLWGGVEKGRPVLEPAFELDMPPSLPERGGAYRLEGLNSRGGVVFSLSFDAQPLDHQGSSKGFSFAVPAAVARLDQVAELRLTGPEGTVSRRAATTAEPQIAAMRSQGRVELDWESDDYPMVLVRDPRTGAVISFARGGEAEISSSGQPVEVLLSDGIRTSRSVLP